MNKEFLAKRLTKFKDFEEIADYFISELEKAKREARVEVIKRLKSKTWMADTSDGLSELEEVLNVEWLDEELQQTQDK